MCPIFPTSLPAPFLTLRLGSSSVLDTLVLDANDDQSSLRPVFSIETDNDDTSVYRHDHDAYPDPTARLVAAIKWASTSHKSLVSVDGQTQFASNFLKKSVLGGSRKFHVPGQSNALKWKLVGSHYECTLCSHACTVHRAVATLDLGHTTALPRLSLFASSVVNNNNSSDTYKGVDSSLLEYLIVTSILLLRKDKDHSAPNTPSVSHFLAPTTPTTISSSSSGSYSPLFSTSPAAACHRSTSTRSTRSSGHRTPASRPVIDLLEDDDAPSPITPYSPNKPPHSPMLKPITNSPRLRISPMLKPLSGCPSPFSSASSSSSVAGGSISSLPASPVMPYSHMSAQSPLNQDTFATANFQVLNGAHRTEPTEETTVPFQIPLPASHEQRKLSHSTSYGQLSSPASASSNSTFTQSPLTYMPFASPSTHHIPTPTLSSPSPITTNNVTPTGQQSQRTYAPTPTRPPATSTNHSAETNAGYPMGRSHSHGGIPRKIANKLPSPILSSLAFFHHHSHSQSSKSSGNSRAKGGAAAADHDHQEREPAAGPGAITPYQLPPTPNHPPPPPPPSAPATTTTYRHGYSTSLGSSSGSTISRDATITPYTLPARSPRLNTLPNAHVNNVNDVAHREGNALLLETDTGSNMTTSLSGPNVAGSLPVQYTTEMYHIMFETGQYASNSNPTLSSAGSQQRRESSTLPLQRRASASQPSVQQLSRRDSMPSQPSRRDSSSGGMTTRPARIFQEVPAPSASDLEALGIADFFGTGPVSRGLSSPRGAGQAHPLVQSSPRFHHQPTLLVNTNTNTNNNLPSPSPRLDHHSRSPITRTQPIDDFEQLGVDGRLELGIDHDGDDDASAEPLPSYNEIEWTVRVRQPRVHERGRQNVASHGERAFAGHGQDGVLGLALVH